MHTTMGYNKEERHALVDYIHKHMMVTNGLQGHREQPA